ncbi:MAG: response regulator transcription factor [Xanthomonadaceae bacterium]|nr:response regulator transcription factor [Xanthomonadaceae bacterium]
MSKESVTVHLVDDDASVREACRFVLEDYGYAVRCWPDGAQFLAGVDPHTLGVVILDLRMPGLYGDAVQARLEELGSTLGVIMLTAHGDVDSAVTAMKQGAVDFLQKPISGRELVVAIDAALERSRKRLAQHRLQRRLARLTQREREIAERVALGATNREIAEQLHVSVRTVEVHRANLMRKLGADSLAELIRIWQQGQAEA